MLEQKNIFYVVNPIKTRCDGVFFFKAMRSAEQISRNGTTQKTLSSYAPEVFCD